MKTLTAQQRDTAHTNEYLRTQGIIPAVAYNKETETKHIQVPENIVRSIWKDIKDKQEFTLDIDGDKLTVTLQDMDVHVVSGSILHMDFLIK